MKRLEDWFKENKGYLHPSVHLATNSEHGSHFLATKPLTPGTRILTVPHSLALSSLNAQVDDAFPVFKQQATAFTVEALGFFYLMSQWVYRETSFWKPYLDTLPTPEQGFGTPFWFDEDDLAWLQGTDLHASFLARREIWQRYWSEGLQILESAGMDTEPYTWELFRWAATVFTSRSFNSNTVRPQDNKYWTAYKHGSSGSQAILLDLQHVAEERKTFPILFPVMDAGNHKPTAKVVWSYNSGLFGLTLQEEVAADVQIFNNYGPKSNDELLMGYGFCVEHHPYDCVRLAMKAPPEPLQQMLRLSHPNYFMTKGGEWSSEVATFNITRPTQGNSSSVWDCIPVPLVEMFCYIVLLERGLDVVPIEEVEQYLFHGRGARYLPRIAFHIMMFLTPRIARVAQYNTTLPTGPQNVKQANAKIYRDGQLDIMQRTRDGLAEFLDALRSPLALRSASHTMCPAMWTLEEALDRCKAEAPALHKAFTAGLKYCFGTSKMRKLRGTEQEEQVWALWLCFTYLQQQQQQSQNEAPQSKSLDAWLRSLRAEYGDVVAEDDSEDEGGEGPATDLLLGVRKAAMFLPGSIWTSPAWSADLILDWGVRIAKCQGTYMDVGGDDVRYVVYLHADGDELSAA